MRGVAYVVSLMLPIIPCTTEGPLAEGLAELAATAALNTHEATGPALAGSPDPAPMEAGAGNGIWIGPAEIAALPMSGDAWVSLATEAQKPCGEVDLSDQDQTTNVCVMAKALVYARTGDGMYARDVLGAIREIVDAPTYDGRALALGRELGAYVIAADLIDLAAYAPTLDELFREKLMTLRATPTRGAAADLVDCHEKRPNNWGAHCGATRAAVAVYLGDTADLERTARVFKGYLGDRSSYAGFDYGGPDDDVSWQCDPDRPVGVNPVGCTRSGLSIDGVLPDDQRRGGGFTTAPPKENYVWEALQGLLAQAVILYRAGYPVWDWEDRALLRAVQWLHDVVDYPAEGDDTWQPHIVNHYYGTSFPAPAPARAGKNVGWTDWTHGAYRVSRAPDPPGASRRWSGTPRLARAAGPVAWVRDDLSRGSGVRMQRTGTRPEPHAAATPLPVARRWPGESGPGAWSASCVEARTAGGVADHGPPIEMSASSPGGHLC